MAIEEPFSILPLEQLCDVLEANIWELRSTHSSCGGAGQPQQAAGRLVRSARQQRRRWGAHGQEEAA